MLRKKMFRTMGQYKAQFISMIIMITLGIGMFVGFNMEWVSIEENMASFFEDCGFADYRIYSELGFSEEEMEKIGAVEGVDAVSRYLSVNVDVKDGDGDSLALTVTTNPAVSGFIVMSGSGYDENDTEGIWLSDKYAAANGIGIGDELSMTYESVTFSGKVAGLIKAAEQLICVTDESQLMPDFNTYGFAYVSPAFYKNVMPLGITFYPMINVCSDLSKKEFFEKADAALGKTTVILTKDETISYSEAEGEAEEGKTMGSVLPVLFLLIAVLTMVTTMHRLVAKEKTQIGTLKALGYRDRTISLHYTSYAFLIGIAGTILGSVMGYFVCWMIMNPNGMMGTYLDMPEWKIRMPLFCILIMLGIIALLALVGFLSVREMLKGSAAESLLPYVPSAVKPMLIERAKFFHRLSFGTRWNMRDMVRHKARTAMSLIGTIGCTILVIGSLGMNDTMRGFIDLYYDKSLNYASRIYLSSNAAAEQIEEVIDRYQGDSSASQSVQIEDETISLDIYDLSRGKLHLLSENGTAIEMSDDGCYICIRIADEFGLKEGDTFEVSPFGTDDVYTLKVAGIMRNVSKSVAMTPAYAALAGIDYTIDSVYVDAEKSEIETDDVISSVQSKQMIMDSFDTFTGILNIMIYLLIIGALLLGVVVLYNLGVMSYTERYREMATLKVVGFRDNKIGSLLIGQNLSLSVIGVIIGIPLGILTMLYLLTALAGEYEMMLIIKPLSYCIGTALIVGMSLLVSLMVSRKNKKIDMVEALKGTE